jgi:hypothetical protein
MEDLSKMIVYALSPSDSAIDLEAMLESLESGAEFTVPVDKDQECGAKAPSESSIMPLS